MAMRRARPTLMPRSSATRRGAAECASLAVLTCPSGDCRLAPGRHSCCASPAPLGARRRCRCGGRGLDLPSAIEERHGGAGGPTVPADGGNTRPDGRVPGGTCFAQFGGDPRQRNLRPAIPWRVLVARPLPPAQVDEARGGRSLCRRTAQRRPGRPAAGVRQFDIDRRLTRVGAGCWLEACAAELQRHARARRWRLDDDAEAHATVRPAGAHPVHDQPRAARTAAVSTASVPAGSRTSTMISSYRSSASSTTIVRAGSCTSQKMRLPC